MTLTAVGFDLDETLAVPSKDRETLLREAVEATGAPRITRQAYLEAHRDNLTEETREPIFASLLDGHDTETTAEALTTAYRERINRSLSPLAGAEPLLAALRSRYRIGLLTNGPVEAQHAKIRTLGWQDAFDCLLVTGSLEAGKPDARAFRALLSELGSDAGETAYVGDEVDADVGGASAAGIHAIQVLYENGPDPDPRATAHVERTALSTQLPAILADL